MGAEHELAENSRHDSLYASKESKQPKGNESLPQTLLQQGDPETGKCDTCKMYVPSEELSRYQCCTDKCHYSEEIITISLAGWQGRDIAAAKVSEKQVNEAVTEPKGLKWIKHCGCGAEFVHFKQNEVDSLHLCLHCKRNFSSGRDPYLALLLDSDGTLVISNLENKTCKDVLGQCNLLTVAQEDRSEEGQRASNFSHHLKSSPFFSKPEKFRTCSQEKENDGSSQTSSKEEDTMHIKLNSTLEINTCRVEDISNGSSDACKICNEAENSVAVHLERKSQPLYALRRNPKRSRRFIDQEYTLEVIASTPAPKKTSSTFSEKARACTECGKEFSSWKALFGHMRCHPEREWRGIQPPTQQELEKGSSKRAVRAFRKKKPPTLAVLALEESDSENKKATDKSSDSDTESIEAAILNGRTELRVKRGRVTGKRSKRSRQTMKFLHAVTYDSTELTVATTPTEIKEERDMANCLVMLAFAERRSPTEHGSQEKQDINEESDYSEYEESALNAQEFFMYAAESETQPQTEWKETVCALHNKEYTKSEADNLSLCEHVADEGRQEQDETSGKLKYECSTCKRIFKSHQALGGHRASHKKVKGCFARTSTSGGLQENFDEEATDEEMLRSEEQLPVEVHETSQSSDGEKQNFFLKLDETGETVDFQKKLKCHECSICHRVFASGQALGGHKRCHWGGSEATNSAATTAKQLTSIMQQVSGQISRHTKDDFLDLNLPAPPENDDLAAQPYTSMPQLVPARSVRQQSKIIDDAAGHTDTKADDIVNDRAYNIYLEEHHLKAGIKINKSYNKRLKNILDAPVSEEQGFINNNEEEIFSTCRYVRCNICDGVFNPVESSSSHQ